MAYHNSEQIYPMVSNVYSLREYQYFLCWSFNVAKLKFDNTFLKFMIRIHKRIRSGLKLDLVKVNLLSKFLRLKINLTGLLLGINLSLDQKFKSKYIEIQI